MLVSCDSLNLNLNKFNFRCYRARVKHVTEFFVTIGVPIVIANFVTVILGIVDSKFLAVRIITKRIRINMTIRFDWMWTEIV